MITTIVKFLLIICMVLTPVGAYLIIDTLTTYEQNPKAVPTGLYALTEKPWRSSWIT